MDSQSSVVTITNDGGDVQAQEKEVAFLASWEAADAALLHPSNLTIPKARRAWDRQPLKPFMAPRTRSSRVWKRPTSSRSTTTSNDAGEDDRVSKRRKARDSSSGFLKPVKKMCLSSEFGLGARVLQWDAVESPMRKIATRSTASGDEIVALPEESDEAATDEEGDVTVEILDENGMVLDVGGEELADEPGWEDEVDAGGEDQKEALDGTMMHLGDLVAAGEEMEALSTSTEAVPQASALETDLSQPVESETQNEQAGIASADSDAFEGRAGEGESSRPVVQVGLQDFVLPEGFVSPMKRSQPFDRRSSRKSLNARRRTLPQQFAPVLAPLQSIPSEFSSSLEQRETTTGVDEMEVNEEAASADQVEDDAAASAETETDQGWEDVDETSEALQTVRVDEDHEADILQDREMAPTDEFVTAIHESQQLGLDNEMDAQAVVAHYSPQQTESTLSAYPLLSIDGQHELLPRRRSPRRKSSSPMKQSSILLSTEKPHLVAFTPLKGPPRYPSPSKYPGLDNPFLDESESNLEQPSPLERAASAPPEEPMMSPQKPSKPRISDDTALLQAFLNRAAESKSSRRISATKRESITNRRDSDAVRQALASPAKAEVLADLDPNSPSPRKPSGTLDNGSVFDGIELGHGANSEDQFDDVKSGPTTRRGDRAARRAQPSTPAAPNKIAIRGNADSFLLKRSEAQELATLTRNNTRKNKGGSVLPPLRLTKLASQASSLGDTAENSSDATEAEKVLGSRNVRWAETLVEFYQGGEVSEVSVLSDELNITVQLEPSGSTDKELVASQPPPPSETPSKPKIRRLKAPRTAATPGKPATAAPEPETDKLVVPEAAAAKEQAKSVSSTKRRSRIATPAKGLTNAALLPSGVEPEPVQPPAAGRKVAPKKKATVSKLPAPSSTAPTSVSTSLGQGKENLISSPPKKRAVPTAKVFAPKLDFAKKTQLPSAPTGSESTSADVVPGLMSPAKKAKGRGIVFANVAAPDFSAEKEEAPGLSSPAKKRTRRAGGV